MATSLRFCFFFFFFSSLLRDLTSAGDYKPEESYYINCGSRSTPQRSDDGRDFAVDNSKLGLFQSSSSSSSSSSSDQVLENPSHSPSINKIYSTARIFTSPYWYSFNVPINSTVFLRLHFLPFSTANFDLRNSSLQLSSSSSASILLLQNFTISNTTTPTIKEFLLLSSNSNLNLTFQPSPDHNLSFVNAIELFTAPTNFTNSTDLPTLPWLSRAAMETLHRINAGGPPINSTSDPLWRSWVNDRSFLYEPNGAVENSTNATLQYASSLSDGISTPEIAPEEVYRTLEEKKTDGLPNSIFNITWLFPVDSGYRYLLRLHFCDFVSDYNDLNFPVFVNNKFAIRNLRPSKFSNAGNGTLVPFFVDFATEISTSDKLIISIGGSRGNAIVNGFEVFKVNNSAGSLDGENINNSGDSSKGGSPPTTIVVVVVAAVAASFILFALVGCFAWKKWGKNKKKSVPTPEKKGDTEVHSGLEIPLEEIQRATGNFDEQRVIGSGGFGKVFLGELRKGVLVAVKCASLHSRQGFPEFHNEIMLLSQVRHRHLVSLIGYTDEKGVMALVYEYMPRGTLREVLKTLTWTQRIEACVGAARGLHYLHTGFAQSIIHRDVKSSNILLDEEYTAKVADFGLSRLGPATDESHVSTAVKGSLGYLDPEYFLTQKLTDKSDVYSFGVVLLEALSGRPVIDTKRPNGEINLAEWAKSKTSEGKVEEIVDRRLGPAVAARTSARKVAELATRCLVDVGRDRPSIGDVLWALENVLQLCTSEDSVAGSEKIDDVESVTPVESTGATFSDRRGLTESDVFSQFISDQGR